MRALVCLFNVIFALREGHSFLHVIVSEQFIRLRQSCRQLATPAPFYSNSLQQCGLRKFPKELSIRAPPDARDCLSRVVGHQCAHIEIMVAVEEVRAQRHFVTIC